MRQLLLLWEVIWWKELVKVEVWGVCAGQRDDVWTKSGLRVDSRKGLIYYWHGLKVAFSLSREIHGWVMNKSRRWINSRSSSQKLILFFFLSNITDHFPTVPVQKVTVGGWWNRMKQAEQPWDLLSISKISTAVLDLIGSVCVHPVGLSFSEIFSLSWF